MYKVKFLLDNSEIWLNIKTGDPVKFLKTLRSCVAFYSIKTDGYLLYFGVTQIESPVGGVTFEKLDGAVWHSPI